MADLNIRFHIRLSRQTFRWTLLAVLLSVCAGEIASESFTMTSYYPAPSGIYTQMITTGKTYLARDGDSVGVGTTSPAAKLHVAGTARVVGQTFIDNSGNSHGVVAGSGALVVDGAAAAGSTVLNLRDGVGANPIYVFDDTAFHTFTAMGAETFRVNRSGSVGVGTTGPANKLDVNGNMAVGSYAGANAGPANGLIVSGNVGIGTTSPATKLHVSGSLRVADGTQAAGKVLTSDANGTATWVAPAAAPAFSCLAVWTAAATSVANAVCPAGYLPTGGGCQSDNPIQDSRLTNGGGAGPQAITTANWWRCAAFSTPIANPRVWAYAVCCKI